MTNCALAPLPRRGVQLEEWQEYAISTIQAYLHQASQERMPLTPIVCNFPNFSNERHHIVPWLSYRIQKVCEQGDAHAERLARDALATHQGIHAAAFDGISFVSPYGWCYEEDSWRPTNNKKLCYLARSMLNGYRLDKPIQSRTNDLRDWDGSGLLLNRLHFGDGQARGLAVWFAWNVMLKYIDTPNFISSPNFALVFRSLLLVPAVFQDRHQGLSRRCLVRQHNQESEEENLEENFAV